MYFQDNYFKDYITTIGYTCQQITSRNVAVIGLNRNFSRLLEVMVQHHGKGPFYMANLEKLTALQSQMKKKTSNLEKFDEIVVVHVGCEPSPYFPKVKNSDGTKVKDENGNDKRSETPTGWTYTFVEFGTAKDVKVVLRERVKIDLLETYAVSGAGYNIKSSRMLFIEQDGQIKKY